MIPWRRDGAVVQSGDRWRFLGSGAGRADTLTGVSGLPHHTKDQHMSNRTVLDASSVSTPLALRAGAELVGSLFVFLAIYMVSS